MLLCMKINPRSANKYRGQFPVLNLPPHFVRPERKTLLVAQLCRFCLYITAFSIKFITPYLIVITILVFALKRGLFQFLSFDTFRVFCQKKLFGRIRPKITKVFSDKRKSLTFAKKTVYNKLSILTLWSTKTNVGA